MFWRDLGLCAGETSKLDKSYRKEVFAAMAPILSIAASLLTIGKTLSRLRIPVAVAGVVACLYVFSKKVPSEIEPSERRPLLPFWGRLAALAGLAISVGVLTISVMDYLPAPHVDRLVPIDPVAGAELQVFGRNLPAADALLMRIGQEPVSEVLNSTPDYLAVRVPQNATSGPIVLTERRRLLPDRQTVYPVASVQNLSRDVVLLTEDIRESGPGAAVLFTILNTSRHGQATVNDLRLETLLVANLGGRNYQQERVDLGVFSVLDGHGHGTSLDLQSQKSIHLMDSKYTHKLQSMDSASFQFELAGPAAQHHMAFAFIIVMEYFNQTGARGYTCSNRVFTFEMNEGGRIQPSDNLPLERSSIESFRRKHGCQVAPPQ